MSNIKTASSLKPGWVHERSNVVWRVFVGEVILGRVLKG